MTSSTFLTLNQIRPPFSATNKDKPHLRYIDCIRGYAILMVITKSVAYEFPNLPFPVHRLAVSGWFGVQLFFLASCVTLLMSWKFEGEKNGSPSVVAFFIRRFFRIAPAYYLAGVLYYFIAPPLKGFDTKQLIASATFINAWHPVWTPTVHDAWTVVPGGWSIGVEFSFYLMFPLFALWVNSLRRAVIVLAVSILIGIVANKTALALLTSSFRPYELGNFLFFWFPNQMSVFALGAVVFFLIQSARSVENWSYLLLRRYSTLLVGTSFALFCALAYLPLGHYWGDIPYVPAHFAAAIPLAALILALSTRDSFLSNRYAAAVGKVSFSAYLTHWALLRIFLAFPLTLHVGESGYRAVLAFIIGWILLVVLTCTVSSFTYRFIELPMMKFAKILITAQRAHNSDDTQRA